MSPTVRPIRSDASTTPMTPRARALTNQSDRYGNASTINEEYTEESIRYDAI
jgi:hypothetical protein